MQIQVYQPSNNPFKLHKLVVTSTQHGKNKQKWSQIEYRRYIVFLESYKHNLLSNDFKELKKYYPLMAKAVQSRNWNQCRIFHQRMLKKYSNVNSIINLLPSNINQQNDQKIENMEQNQLFEFNNTVTFTNKFNKQEKNKVQKLSKVQLINLRNFEQDKNDKICIEQQDKDEKMIPTDVTYQEQKEINDKAREGQEYPLFFKQKYNSGAKRDQHRKYMESIFNLPLFPMTPFQAYSLYSLNSNPSNRRLAEWMNCHNLYIQWMNSLQNLINSEHN